MILAFAIASMLVFSVLLGFYVLSPVLPQEILETKNQSMTRTDSPCSKNDSLVNAQILIFNDA